MPENYEAHLYLDVDQATVAWNVARGGFCSPNILRANTLFHEDCLPLSFAARSQFGCKNRLISECAIEQLRRSEFPSEVSRLMGFFVFKTVDDISALWEAEDWQGHFSDEFLGDCGVQSCKESKVDANWIPLIIDRSGNLTNDWHVFARRYWQGEKAPGKPPIWETIVSGCASIWETDLKRRARGEIEKFFSAALPALDYSEVCFDLGSLDGTLYPLALSDGKNFNVHDEFFQQDLHRTEHRSSLSKGVYCPNSNSIRIFNNFDLIKWPKLDEAERKIPLSEIARILREANVT